MYYRNTAIRIIDTIRLSIFEGCHIQNYTD